MDTVVEPVVVEPVVSTVDAAASKRRVVVVDLGKSKRGKVRKLKKGAGPLMGKVHDVVNGLTANNSLTASDALTVGSAPVVVVVVERRPRERFKLFG